MWCNLTGGSWNKGDGTEGNYGANGEVGVAGCERGGSGDSGSGSNENTAEFLFPAEIDLGAPPLFVSGRPMEGGGPSGETGNGTIYYGGANPSTAGGSTTVVAGGTGNSTPVYGGGAIWVMRWVSDGDGCIVQGSSDGSDIGGSGNTGDSSIGSGDECSGTNASPVGHWENVLISSNTAAYLLIKQLGINDSDTQLFLNDNYQVAIELHEYLLTNGSTQANKNFVNWALEYLMDNTEVIVNIPQIKAVYYNSLTEQQLNNIGLSKLNISGTNSNIIIPLAYRASYPKFCNIVDGLYNYALQNPHVLDAMLKYVRADHGAYNYADLHTDAQVKSFILYHLSTINFSVSVINVEIPLQSMASAGGWWIEGDVINFNADMLRMLENLPAPYNEPNSLRLYLISTVLHEFIHWGSNLDYIPYPTDPLGPDVGVMFEFDAYGQNISLPKSIILKYK